MENSQSQKLDDETAEAALLRWRNDPVLYAEERLGISNLDVHEKEMLDALPFCMNKLIPLVVSSAHAMGKDFTIDGIGVLWFIECFGPCKVVMTGPTDRQVKEIMWTELKRAYNNRLIKGPFGRMITCKLELSDDWFVLAFTTKETGEGAGKFQGIHSPRIMVVVSEAQKVDDKIKEQIDGITTSGSVLQVYLGNPLRTTGFYAKMIKDTSHNVVIHLDAHDSINYKAGREIVPGLVGRQYVEMMEERYNKDKSNTHPLYRAKVLGQLPLTAIDTLISDALYDSCVNRVMQIGLPKRGVVSADPAREGDDPMVIRAWESGRLIDKKSIPKCTATAGGAEMAMMVNKHFPDGQCVLICDCDGLGGPYIDIAKNILGEEKGFVFVEYKGSCHDYKIIDPMYHNLRSEAMHWCKSQMELGLVSLDEDDGCKEEATAHHYFINPSSGRVQIEDKDEVKETLGRSPNEWDATVMGIWGFKYAPIIKPKDMYAGRNENRSSMVPSVSSFMSA